MLIVLMFLEKQIAWYVGVKYTRTKKPEDQDAQRVHVNCARMLFCMPIFLFSPRIVHDFRSAISISTDNTDGMGQRDLAKIGDDKTQRIRRSNQDIVWLDISMHSIHFV